MLDTDLIFAFYDDCPMHDDGGGMGVKVGRRGSLGRAMSEAERWLRMCCDKPFSRVQVKAPGEHPWWYYLDGDGRLCVWRLRAQDCRQAWGFTS
jgi:hypothetical protein